MSRIRLKKGKQKLFLNRIAEYFDFNWPKIASIINVSERTIRDWRIERYNMNYEALLKLHKISNISIPKAIEILPEYWSTKKASKLGGITRNKLYGNPGTLEGRRKGGINSQKLFRTNPEYAKKLGIKVRKTIKMPLVSEELAEFIGIMLGDGGISEYQINITLNAQSDKEYAVYVQRLIKNLFLITASIKLSLLDNTNRIIVSARNLVEFLRNRGLKKSGNFKNIPQWILSNKNCSISCLRGLIDTDGSFYAYNHKVFNKTYYNFAMCFTNHSSSLLRNVYKILKRSNFNPVMGTKHVYLHKMEEIGRYFKKIGTHNPKHLQKYKDYIDTGGRGTEVVVTGSPRKRFESQDSRESESHPLRQEIFGEVA